MVNPLSTAWQCAVLHSARRKQGSLEPIAQTRRKEHSLDDTLRVGSKRALLLTALAVGACLISMARADGNSMNSSTGESHAAFDSGYSQPTICNPHVDPSLSAWRQAHPNGLSERALQALSSEAWAWRSRATRGSASLAAEAPTTMARSSATPLGAGPQ